ncbi:tRNA (adenosine(37)-N6)-threonylcarbamoyltransferase complex ATPase subunit type 1 TsaE [Candidatus Aerophobetes bacterium]|nr:tRNA (adenosine(37)-N6)-threonylcarbamoyltransferase complex ATPase subunit type 1 TsaE [Candidatus Aerophobetes bacterium]
MNDEMLVVYTKSEEETIELGFKVGKNIFYPSMIALMGELGSGKTTLTRGIARGMGIKVRVKSPSFVIINEYQGPHPLYHFDLYRLDDVHQLEELGYQEYFYTSCGVVVIEWAEKIIDFLPPEYLRVKIQIEDFTMRKVMLTPGENKGYHRLIENIKSELKC